MLVKHHVEHLACRKKFTFSCSAEHDNVVVVVIMTHLQIVVDVDSCLVCPWIGLDCAVFYVLPTQYRLYGRRFLQVKRPNQQYQSTEGDATKEKAKNENM